MVTDEVHLYNLALNAIGARDNLSATNEKSRGAEVCNLWYPVIRDQVLKAAIWPSCKKFKRLAVAKVKEPGEWMAGDPEPGFQFAYALPADHLYPYHLSHYSRFSMSNLDGTKVLCTNVPQALLAYVSREQLISMWEADLQMAVVYGLAANIVMPLTGKSQRAQTFIQQANDLILTAREGAANEDNNVMESIPDWIAARGYANPGDNRYFYPLGPLLRLASHGK